VELGAELGHNTVKRFDLFIALAADNRMVSKTSELLGFVSFLKKYIFTGITPTLELVWARTIFNESKGYGITLY
jgi:hypothetical protein